LQKKKREEEDTRASRGNDAAGLGQGGYGWVLLRIGLALIWELDWKWALTMDGWEWMDSMGMGAASETSA
jgi:hypothetical protein